MVTACDELASVTLLFIDGSEETFDALSGMTGTFTGTAGLEVSGAWIMVIGEVSGEFFASPGGMCEREEPPGPDPECDYEACVEECEAQGGEYCDYECNC
jgi:hypothetical protein